MRTLPRIKKLFKVVYNSQQGIVHAAPLLLVIVAIGIISFLLVSSTAPNNNNSKYGFLFSSKKSASAALSDPILSPLPGCDLNIVPAGQANPSDEPEPMGPIWCFPLKAAGGAAPSRTTGVNDWVDEFATNIQMQKFGAVNTPSGNNHQDESTDLGYKIFNNLQTGGTGQFKSQGFINNNHWMFDLGGARAEAGTLISPDRSFHWENDTLVVEADVAVGAAELGGADRFVELDVNNAPTITVGKLPSAIAPGWDCGKNTEKWDQRYLNTCKTPDNLYGYGMFPGSWSMGCRLESQGNVICSLYNPDGTSVSSTNHTTGGGRVWEISPTESGGDMDVLGAALHAGTTQAVNWRHCQPNQMDMFCRDRFRMELTRTTLAILINGQMYFKFGVTPGHSIPGIPEAGQLFPSALINKPNYVYYTTWISAFNTTPVTRFHWGRVAVNPHNPDGSLAAPSKSPSYCFGEPQNTCSMNGGGGGLMTPTPSPFPVATPPPTTPPMSPSPTPQATTPPPTTPPTAGGSNLGNTNIGSRIDDTDSNYMSGSRFTTGANGGTVSSMSVYVSDVDSASNNQYQLAIYSDQNGVPGTLIAKSDTGTLKANAWNTLSINTSLSPNASYWLMYNTNGGSSTLNNLALSPGGLGAWSTNGQSFGSWPQSFGPATTASQVYSIYATFGQAQATPPPVSQGSTITITAAGQQANGVNPNMVLNIGGANVVTWPVGGDAVKGVFQAFTFNAPISVTHDKVKIRFTNDYWNPRVSPPQDRNLRVQKINIDGVDYLSTAVSVYGVGVSVSGSCGQGFLKTEWLFCNGYLQY